MKFFAWPDVPGERYISTQASITKGLTLLLNLCHRDSDTRNEDVVYFCTALDLQLRKVRGYDYDCDFKRI